MKPLTLTRRQLNRALLTRQMLLERAAFTPLEAIQRLAGLQAQLPNPPYIGLWTRLATFARDDLTRLMEHRQVVRAALLRSTLHLVTAPDHHLFRPPLQPALARALNAFFGQRAKGLDIDRLIRLSKPYIEEAPRTTGEIRALLKENMPERDGDALAYAVRNFLPLVQVPPAGTWGTGSLASYTTAEAWLGPIPPETDNLRQMLLRYLTAFGPASVMDFQAWSGLVKLGDSLAPFKAELRVFQDENGRELLDVPEGDLPSEDTPAPVRFVPEYDNLVISHADRTRVLADDDYSKVFLSAGRVLGTILVDGFVAGTWKVEKAKKRAALVISPFRPLAEQDRAALLAEGQALIRFIEDGAEVFDVQLESG